MDEKSSNANAAFHDSHIEMPYISSGSNMLILCSATLRKCRRSIEYIKVLEVI